LESLGDPKQFRDTFSRFRWYTNQAAIQLLENQPEMAAKGFLEAFELAPDHEKAHINKAHAYLLLKNIEAAESFCQSSLVKFPNCAPLWALLLNVRLIKNDSDPERDLPESVRLTNDILFTRAHIAEKRGDYEVAVDLLKQCVDQDPESYEAKRAYLVAALSWADSDPVLAHYGQLTTNQRMCLEDAVARMEPLEQTLPGIQSEHISLEVTNNIVGALMLLGQSERGHSMATFSLRRHPQSDGLLRIRLQELANSENFAEIHALTDDRLFELSPAVLGTLAEISANHGQVDWFEKVMVAAEVSCMESEKLELLRVLVFHAQWCSGAKKQAVKSAETFIDAHPTLILPRVILANMLLKLGQEDDAIRLARSCIFLLDDDSKSFHVMHVADIHFQLSQFHDAATLYRRLVKTPGNDEFTQKCLISLIESDQRWQAQQIFDQLELSIRSLPQFIRIEANLARKVGDWHRMRDLLAKEIIRDPQESRAAVGYVGAAHRLGNKDELLVYLASDPKFKNATPEEEFEFAKYQDFYGLTPLAIHRLYRAYRTQPNNIQLASFYLCQMLIGKNIHELDIPLSVQPGSAVQLRTATETKLIAIDFENSDSGTGWSELIVPDEDLAKILIGKQVGDKVNYANIFTDQLAEIVTIESIYHFAAKKAHEQIAASPIQSGPLWSVKVIKDNGELDIESLLEATKQRNKRVHQAFDNYQKQRFPLSLLAKAIGSDPVTLITEWPFKEVTLFIGIGTHEEREAAFELLRSTNKRYVLDLLTIAELLQRKAFSPVIKVIGTPMVPQTLREHVLILQQLDTGPQATGSLVEENGNLKFTETSEDYFIGRAKLLADLLACIDQYCEVVPTYGPQQITSIHETIAHALDVDTLDAIYLAAEHSAVLISEDGALRLLAAEVGVSCSMGIQPILMEAHHNGFIEQYAYSGIFMAKLMQNHSFVSIRSEDLYVFAKRMPTKVTDEVKIVLESFREPTLDIVSGVRVVSEFLRHAAKKLPPATVISYAKLGLAVLQDGRQNLSKSIRLVVGFGLKDLLQNRKRKLTGLDRQFLESLSESPAVPQFLPRMSPLAQAIQSLCRKS
jgi:tetratricopeptide (TPR) repeat protein